MSKPRDYERTEIGQMILAGNELFDFDVDTYVERGLEELGEVICELKLCPTGFKDDYSDPTNNVGAEMETPVFAMRSYCWCDGEADGHENDCPPNFHHFASGFKVNWYKYLCRGTQQNRTITRKEWREILNACLASLPLPDGANEMEG